MSRSWTNRRQWYFSVKVDQETVSDIDKMEDGAVMRFIFWSQSAFTCSKLTTERLEQCVNDVNYCWLWTCKCRLRYIFKKTLPPRTKFQDKMPLLSADTFLSFSVVLIQIFLIIILVTSPGLQILVSDCFSANAKVW